MIDSVNRVVLALLGLAVTAAAVAGLLAARGWLRVAEPATLYERAVTTLETPEGMAVTAAAGLVLVALGLWWVSRQITPPVSSRVDTLTIHHNTVVQGEGRAADQEDSPGPPARGRTTLHPDAVARAVAADFARLPGVEDAGCRLVTAGPRPRLRVRAELHADADVQSVRVAAEQVYGRLCRLLGVESVYAEVQLRPRDREGDRSRVV